MGSGRFCRSKVTYMSKSEAKLGLKRAAGRGANVRRAYRCPECGFWHLTKHTSTEYQRRLAGVR